MYVCERHDPAFLQPRKELPIPFTMQPVWTFWKRSTQGIEHPIVQAVAELVFQKAVPSP